MNITVNGVTFDLVSDLAIKVFSAKAAVEQYEHDAFVDYHKAQYPQEVHDLMRDVQYADVSDPIYEYKDTIEEMYWELDEIESRAYRKANMAQFLEYQSHMNEPDFDWDFYSDWHKDMYGFRPR